MKVKRPTYIFNLPVSVRDIFEHYAGEDLQSAPSLGVWAPVTCLPVPDGAELVFADLDMELNGETKRNPGAN